MTSGLLAGVCANPNVRGAVFVSLERQNHCLQVQIEDEGIFRPRMPVPELSLSSNGRGILLMTAVMDELFVRRGSTEERGTIVRLVKCWGS